MAFVSSTAANGTMEEAETVVIVGVEGGGTVLRLAGPLLYRHLGETYTVAGPHGGPLAQSPKIRPKLLAPK